jgi:hypothetical protein
MARPGLRKVAPVAFPIGKSVDTVPRPSGPEWKGAFPSLRPAGLSAPLTCHAASTVGVLVSKPGFPGQRSQWPKTSCHPLPPPRDPVPAAAQHSQVDFVIETGDTLVCPGFPQLGQNVAQSI